MSETELGVMMARDLVFFAGAGVSTPGNTGMPPTRDLLAARLWRVPLLSFSTMGGLCVPSTSVEPQLSRV